MNIPNGPSIPRPIYYRETEPEEGPWAMIPYAWIYPKPFDPSKIPRVPQPIYLTKDGYVEANMPVAIVYRFRKRNKNEAWLPPPVMHTEMMSAAQTYPL